MEITERATNTSHEQVLIGRDAESGYHDEGSYERANELAARVTGAQFPIKLGKIWIIAIL